VVEEVDLAIHPREYLALIGPNGGGKTTLVKLILGLLKPWSGEVRFRYPGGRPRLGYVPQYSTFDPNFPLRVGEAVLMGRLGNRGLLRPYGGGDRAAVAATLERLGLAALARTQLAELSGGQLQRVLIARALVCEPQILFLDEPTASIDAESRQVLREILLELNRTIPIVVVTHDVTAIPPPVERIAYLNRRLCLHRREELISGADGGIPGFAAAPFAPDPSHRH
jgi:zinc transport system ATP-binding protein